MQMKIHIQISLKSTSAQSFTTLKDHVLLYKCNIYNHFVLINDENKITILWNLSPEPLAVYFKYFVIL
jgi:cytochrome oxidase Cu insertion factor (SCO1/SenC/PrrC family)